MLELYKHGRVLINPASSYRAFRCILRMSPSWGAAFSVLGNGPSNCAPFHFISARTPVDIAMALNIGRASVYRLLAS
jgi:hypothetical protein